MGETVLDDPLQLLVHQLHALETRRQQESDLSLDEQLECHFGDEEGRSRAHGVADGVENVGASESVQRFDGVQGRSERVVEDVADACPTGELVGLDVARVALDLLAVGGGELRERLQKGGALVLYRDPQCLQLCLVHRQLGADVVAEDRQGVAYVLHEEFVEGLGEIGTPVPRRQPGILLSEEGLFILERVSDGFLVSDILLAPVHDPDDPEFDGNDLTSE